MHEDGERAGTLVGATLGNYQVTGQIGRGGMGAVYRAVDKRLGRSVAIKSLLHEDADPRGRRRLMDEARRASRVASPYVATVFDVVEDRDRCYIVMEEIEGRRLDAVIGVDHPGTDELTRYAAEIAEALAAIHRAGIVHRDLKPANVMITATGHVKVMDFGLAQDDPSAWLEEVNSGRIESTTQSTPGAIAGTISYMSPEQIRGEPLDGRSDLFSFGTVLREALIGHHPFQRDSILETASAILHEKPAAIAEADPPPSPALYAVSERLLEKERDKRYPSAEAVLVDLAALAKGARGGRKRWAPWAALATAAAVVAVGLVAWSLRPSPPPSTRPVVAILPFEDRTGEPKGDLRAALLADLLAASLADSDRVRPLAADRIREIVSGLPPRAPQSRMLAAVAGATPVRWLVTGSVFKEGDAYYASIVAFTPGEANPIGSYRVSASGSAAMAERAGAILRDKLFGDRRGSDEAAALWRSTSDEAQLLEKEARGAIRELRYGEAIEKLERALSLDPTFILARVRLAEALDGSGYGTRARDAASRAMRDIDGLGTDAARSSFAAEARAIEARTRGDVGAEIEARRAVVAAHGDDPAAHLTLANALNRRAKYADALPEAQLAISLDPKDPGAHLAEGIAFRGARKFEEALASLKRADEAFVSLESKAGHAAVEQALAELSYNAARYPEARQHYEAAATTFAQESLEVRAARARKGVADTLLQEGNLEAAVPMYQGALDTARRAGDYRTIVKSLENLGAQHFARGQFEAAERSLREARREALPLESPALLASPTLNLASLLGYTDRFEESRVLAQEALTLARETQNLEVQTGALVLIGDALDAEGRLDEAISAYREIVDSDVLSKAPGAPVGNAYGRLANIYRDRGESRKALEASEKAIAFQETIDKKIGLGYALVSRALARADLGMYGDATADIESAEALASNPTTPNRDLALTASFARARVAVNQGLWDDAERVLAGMRKDDTEAGASWLAVWTPSLSAFVAIERKKHADALRYAKLALSRATHFPRAEPELRAVLARSYAAAGDPRSAEQEARRALAEAERLDLPIAAAFACAVLAQLDPELADRAALRSRGKAALDRLLSGAPDDRIGFLRARKDLGFQFRTLD